MKEESTTNILMFVFDRRGMPPVDFVREDRRGIKAESLADWEL